MLRKWWQQYFADSESLWLFFILALAVLLVVGLGDILAPVFASIVIAYLLDWLAKRLTEKGMPRYLAVLTIFICFLATMFGLIFFIWPIVWKQSLHLVDELPNMFNRAQTLLYLLPEKFPEFVSQNDIKAFTSSELNNLSKVAKGIVTASLASVPNIIAFVVYLFLIPLMVFFFLKDKNKIINWVLHFLPQKRRLLIKVWHEVDDQIGNYVRGKVAEVAIVVITTYVVLAYFKLQYALLLSILVGLSVLVPYIGIVLATLPVILVAFFQYGWTEQFTYVLISYGIVQGFDGIVLVPLLFSEVVNMHPIALVIAILFFGSIWGFWGVFFAIPLATIVKAVLNAWQEDKARIAIEQASTDI